MAEHDKLHKLDWVPIPDEPFIMKYAFSDTDYNIIVSNLMSLYCEKLTDFNIQERFCKLNPYAQMKSQVILENLKKSLEKCLSEKSSLGMKFDENKLIFTLKFPVAHVLCKFDIQMDLMTTDKLVQYVITPTIFGALLSQKKVSELKKRTTSESTKFSGSSSVSVTLQNIIEPEWLKGQNVPIETVLDSFLKLQSHFKELYAEHYETYSCPKKEKMKKAELFQCAASPKKCKLENDVGTESAIVKFDDTEHNISVKQEKEEDILPLNASSAVLSQPTKNTVKKKIFKI